jgi:hypothetical protein
MSSHINIHIFTYIYIYMYILRSMYIYKHTYIPTDSNVSKRAEQLGDSSKPHIHIYIYIHIHTCLHVIK